MKVKSTKGKHSAQLRVSSSSEVERTYLDIRAVDGELAILTMIRLHILLHTVEDHSTDVAMPDVEQSTAMAERGKMLGIIGKSSTGEFARCLSGITDRVVC